MDTFDRSLLEQDRKFAIRSAFNIVSRVSKNLEVNTLGIYQFCLLIRYLPGYLLR